MKSENFESLNKLFDRKWFWHRTSGVLSAALRWTATCENLLRWTLFVFAIFLAWSAPSQSQASKAESEKVSVELANGEWPPFLGAKLPHFGSATRIVTEALAAAGYKAEYKFFPWKRALEEARSGRVAGTLVWLKTDDRVRDFYLSDPVFFSAESLVYLKGTSFDWKQVKDLSAYRIGATTGYDYGADFASAEKQGVIKVNWVPSDEQNISKLLDGRIDVFPLMKEVAIFMTKKSHGESGVAKLAFHPKLIHGEPVHLLISKKFKGGDALMKAFNLELKKMKSKGLDAKYLEEGARASEHP